MRPNFVVLAGLLALAAAAAGGLASAHLFSGTDSDALGDKARAAKKLPVPNVEGKQDKLAVTPATPASGPASVETAMLYMSNPLTAPARVPEKRRPPPVQLSYTLLSEAQIDGIRKRLKLSPRQERYWPAVEVALSRLAKQLHDASRARPADGNVAIDPDSAAVQELRAAAKLLMKELREDQRNEIVTLARVVGLEAAISLL